MTAKTITEFNVLLPSAGSKTRRKKFLGALAPFKTTLYFILTGVSSFFSHSIINSQSGIDCPLLNSSASHLAIYTSVQKKEHSTIHHCTTITNHQHCVYNGTWTYHSRSDWSNIPSFLSELSIFWNIQSDFTSLKLNFCWWVLGEMTIVVLHNL